MQTNTNQGQNDTATKAALTCKNHGGYNECAQRFEIRR